MITRWGVMLALTLVLAYPTTTSAVAQSDPGPPATSIAVVLRIATGPIVQLDGTPHETANRRLSRLAGSLETWREPDTGFPLALAVSPVLCEELDLLDTPQARRVLSLIKTLARRSDVLAAPYADVRLLYLKDESDIRDELANGIRTLRECMDRTPIDVLMPPMLAIDARTVDAARSLGIDVSVSDLAGTTVRSRPTEGHGAITLIPPANPSAFSSGRPASGALIVDASEPSWASRIATAAAAGTVGTVAVSALTADVPEVFVEFPAPPMPGDGRRRAVDRARRALDSFESYTLADNMLARVYRAAYARALATTSDEWFQEFNSGPTPDRTSGERASKRLADAIRDQERKLTTSGETVTFTSRRGSVPVTVTNAADYRVRVLVTVSSPKLDFPDGSSRVVTIDPPGEPIRPFVAITRSTGTFPMIVTLTSPDRSVVFDRAVLSVRSAAVNFSAIVLTAGGAIFLFGWFARRRARRRSAA
ncbi:MAG: hypothetical protein WD646_03515 [Actinomycetota bacterium]